MRFIKKLFHQTKKTPLRSNTKRSSKRAQLSLEMLEGRLVPAVGNWLPPPAGIDSPLPQGLQTEVRMIDSKASLIDSNLVEVFQDIRAAQAMEEFEQLREAAGALFPGATEAEAQSGREAAGGLLGGSSSEGGSDPMSPVDTWHESSGFHWSMRPDGGESRDSNHGLRPPRRSGSRGPGGPPADDWGPGGADRQRLVVEFERGFAELAAIQVAGRGAPAGTAAAVAAGEAVGRWLAEKVADALHEGGSGGGDWNSGDPSDSHHPGHDSEETRRLRRMIFSGTPVINPNPESSSAGGYTGWMLGIPPKERTIGAPDSGGSGGGDAQPEWAAEAGVPVRRHPLVLVSWVVQPIPIP